MKNSVHNNEPKVLVAAQADIQPVLPVLILIVSLVVLLLQGAWSGT